MQILYFCKICMYRSKFEKLFPPCRKYQLCSNQSQLQKRKPIASAHSSTSNRFWYTSRDICWMCTFLAVEVAQHNEKPQPLTTLYLKMTAGAQNCLHKQYTASHCCWCNNGQPKGTKAVAETPPARFSRNFLNENMLNMAKMTSRTIFIRNSKSSAIARSFS